MRRLRVFLGILAAIAGIAASILTFGVNYKNGGLEGVCELISDATTRMGMRIEWLQCGRPALPKSEPRSVPPIPSADELFWLAVKDSTVPALFEEFLRKFPRSSHAAEAQEKLDALKKAAQQNELKKPLPPPPPKPDESARQKNEARDLVSRIRTQISNCKERDRYGSTMLGIMVQDRIRAGSKGQEAPGAPWEVELLPPEVVFSDISDLKLQQYTKDLTVRFGNESYTKTEPVWTIDVPALDLAFGFIKISFEPMWREPHVTLTTFLPLKSRDCVPLGILIRQSGQR
jgi:hypothetical protein